ncbi:MAG: TRAP transporter small permease [Betaproteobacteria bacterium]
MALLLLIAVAINFSNVVGRYAFDHPFGWAEEAMGLLQIGLVIVGASLVTRRNAHLRMDAVEHLVPAGIRRWLEVVAGVLTVAVALVVVVKSWGIVAGMLENDSRTIVLEVPLAVPYGTFLLGFGLVALFALLRVIALVRGR